MIMIDESSSDKQLVQQIQQGSGDAMSILYRRHQPAILRYVQARLYNWQQAKAKAKLFATTAYGYNNITQVETEGIK